MLTLLGVILVSAPAWAQETKEKAATKQMSVEVVAADKAMKTLTVKTDPSSMAGTKTIVAKVDEKAVTLLDTIKPGERVTLTCLAEKDHECDTVTGIKKNPSDGKGAD
jgi:hypothetical protein